MTCFGYSSIKIDKYSNSTAIDRGKVKSYLPWLGGRLSESEFFRILPNRAQKTSNEFGL